MQTQPTTPFGGGRCRSPWWRARRRPRISRQDRRIRNRSAQMAAVSRANRGKEPLGVTDRALSVLHALLSFHQETALTLPASDSKAAEADSAGPGLVVFRPIGNCRFAPMAWRRRRCDAIWPASSTRADHSSRLSERKRFARRGQGGAIEDAFASISCRSSRAPPKSKTSPKRCGRRTARWRCCAKNHADAARHRQDDRDRHRGGVPGDWEGFHLRYATLSGRYARNLLRSDLEALASELTALAAEIRKLGSLTQRYVSDMAFSETV